MTVEHTHDDDRLTFGCPGCIEKAELARIADAPVRRCRWHCTYDTWEGEVLRTLSFTLDVKVPDGWDGNRVDDEYSGLTGEAFVLALPDDVDMDDTGYAMETMEVERVDIGPIIPEAHAPTYEQAALL